MNAFSRLDPHDEPGRIRRAEAAMEVDTGARREYTVDELLYWLPSALRRDPTKFTRDFVVSVLARSKRRGWTPSDKQLAIMCRIVAEMFQADRYDDFDVIDRDG